MIIPPLTTVIIAYLLLLNALAAAVFALDKSRARRKGRRIPEKTLLGLALIGGSLGALASMHLCHHKTRSPQFRWGLPLILILQGSLSLCLLNWLAG